MKLSHISLAIFSAIALAACGGSSNNQVDNTQNGQNDQNDQDQNTNTTPTAPQVSETFTTSVATSLGAQNNRVSITPDFAVFPGSELPRNFVAPARNQALDKAIQKDIAKKQYFANDDLSNDSDNDNEFAQIKFMDDHSKNDNKKAVAVFYKDGDDYKEAYVKAFENPNKDVDGQPDNNYFYVKQNKDGDGAGDTKLKKSEIYQRFDNDKVIVNNVSLLGQSIAAELDSDGSAQFKDLDRSKVKTNEIITSDVEVNSTAHTYVYEMKSGVGVNGLDGFENADKAQNNFVRTDKKGKKANITTKLGSVKAYNLPKSFVAVSLDKDGDLSDRSFFGNALNAAYVNGESTLLFPANITATYTGKAFTADSQADFSVDATFVNNERGYVNNAKITNRTSSDGAEADLVSVNTSSLLNTNNAYSLNLEKADGSSASSEEYNRIAGAFFGVNAEETAGRVFKDNKAVGVFAGKR